MRCTAPREIALPWQIDREREANPKKKFLVTCSYLEIYNEMLYDLLVPARRGPRGDVKGLEIKEHAVLGIYVQNLQVRPVDADGVPIYTRQQSVIRLMVARTARQSSYTALVGLHRQCARLHACAALCRRV